jgi:hypothetical protein
MTEFVDVNVTLAGAAADKFNFGAVMGMFAHSINTDRKNGPYSSIPEVVAAGFTAAAELEVHSWATSVFAQDDGVDSLIIGYTDGIETTTAALDAIEADTPGSDWYITNMEDRTDTEILLAAAWHEARAKIYIAQSSDADILTDVVGNIAEDLEVASYHRTALIYHATDAGANGYLDGAWASSGGGLQLDAPMGAGQWGYRELEGVTFDAVTSTEAAAIYSNNANLFGRNKGLSFTSKGSMASARWIDAQVSLDWLKARMEESILSAFVGAPTKIPFTNAGINILRAAIQEVYDKGIAFGHLSADEPPTLTAPLVSDVSSADKILRQLTMTGNAVLAGAIIKVTFNINVQQ